MSGVATAVISTAVVGGYVQSKAAGDAADAQTKSTDAAIAAQQQADAAAAARAKPFVDLGTGASQELQSFLGISSQNQELADIDQQIAGLRAEQAALEGSSLQSDKGGIPGLISQAITGVRSDSLGEITAQIAALESQRSALAQSVPAQSVTPGGLQQLDEINPLVSFLRDQGFESIQETAAAQGRLGAGGTLKDLTQFNTDLTSTIVPQLQNQRFNQLFNTASLGSNAAAGVSTNQLNTASNIGNLLGAQGQAQAGGIIGGANAITGGIQNIAGAAGAFPGVFGGSSLPPPTTTTINDSAAVIAPATF